MIPHDPLLESITTSVEDRIVFDTEMLGFLKGNSSRNLSGRAAVTAILRHRTGESSPGSKASFVSRINRMADFFGRHSQVLLYVPNLIGYVRVAFALYAFSVAFTNPGHCILFYFASFVCDELDGRFARMLSQTSTLGAVLDMVTDRLATTGLLTLLAIQYPSYLFLFISLVFLDIFSHWFQMYSTLLVGAATHKMYMLYFNEFQQYRWTSVAFSAPQQALDFMPVVCHPGGIPWWSATQAASLG
eukprot:gene142-5396_t